MGLDAGPSARCQVLSKRRTDRDHHPGSRHLVLLDARRHMALRSGSSDRTGLRKVLAGWVQVRQHRSIRYRRYQGHRRNLFPGTVMPVRLESAPLQHRFHAKRGHMKKHNRPRLLLNSETIRHLDIKELSRDRLQLIIGGDGTSELPTLCTTKPT